jgi:hypothetical protein
MQNVAAKLSLGGFPPKGGSPSDNFNTPFYLA